MRPPIFCVVSLERSRGKTSLIERLVRELSRSGIRVATIKHSRERIDLEDKDTYRHLEAGALETVYVSPVELITMRRARASLEDAVSSLHVDPDLILAEGFKSSPYPKILCSRSLEEAEEAVRRISNVVAVVISERQEEAVSREIRASSVKEVLQLIKEEVTEYWVERIPGLNCGRCRYGSCKALAEAIRRGEATIRECVMRSFHSARITIDLEEVPLGPWPQRLLCELIKGFVKSLKLRDMDLEKAEKILVEVDLRSGK
ncbi:MAG: molybdopterin-guanine dinucleotide biosynthesis protein B [Thaumarchaeota archaeon]|nr:MAG: molybdopterin-guanine dinucleotide biosynthesis protein B [Nitrososphaerota archaeon]